MCNLHAEASVIFRHKNLAWPLWTEENKIIENSVHRFGHSTMNEEYQLLPVAI